MCGERNDAVEAQVQKGMNLSMTCLFLARSTSSLAVLILKLINDSQTHPTLQKKKKNTDRKFVANNLDEVATEDLEGNDSDQLTQYWTFWSE